MKKKKLKYAISDIFPGHTFESFLAEMEESRIRDNEISIDEYLENLAEYVGRKLTRYEEEAILCIVDKYTPADEKGNYIVDLLPHEYAWEIYKAKKDIDWKKYDIKWKPSSDSRI